MCLTHLSVFKVEVLDEVGVDSADLWHEVERLVEVLLAQHLELDEVVVVLDLDEPAVGEVAEAVDAGFAGEFHRPD